MPPKGLIYVVAALGASAALAQVQRSGGGAAAANAQLTQQYQQAVAERSKLQAENEKLKQDLDQARRQMEALKPQLAASKSAAGTAASQLAAAQAASQSTSQTLEQTKVRMQELVNRFRDTAVTLRGIEADRTQLQQQLNQSKASFDRCAERNFQLYEVTGEVLDRYEHQGAFGYMAKAEPFTRLKRTQIENFVDETRQRAEELRVQKAAADLQQQPANGPVQFAAPNPPASDSATVGNGSKDR